jgi:hypothetical protein
MEVCGLKRENLASRILLARYVKIRSISNQTTKQKALCVVLLAHRDHDSAIDLQHVALMKQIYRYLDLHIVSCGSLFDDPLISTHPRPTSVLALLAFTNHHMTACLQCTQRVA